MAGVGEVSGAEQLVVRLDLLDEVVAAVDFACVAFRVAESATSSAMYSPFSGISRRTFRAGISPQNAFGRLA